MPQFRTCPGCGAHLDPDEQCEDCTDATKDFIHRNPIYACTVEPVMTKPGIKNAPGLADMRTYKPLIRTRGR